MLLPGLFTRTTGGDQMRWQAGFLICLVGCGSIDWRRDLVCKHGSAAAQGLCAPDGIFREVIGQSSARVMANELDGQ
jgi:hypothetical protein